MKSFPLIGPNSGNSILGWKNKKPISIERFLTDVNHLSQNLLQKSWMLNICSNRYHFLVGFAAAVSQPDCQCRGHADRKNKDQKVTQRRYPHPSKDRGNWNLTLTAVPSSKTVMRTPRRPRPAPVPRRKRSVLCHPAR